MSTGESKGTNASFSSALVASHLDWPKRWGQICYKNPCASYSEEFSADSETSCYYCSCLYLPDRIRKGRKGRTFSFANRSFTNYLHGGLFSRIHFRQWCFIFTSNISIYSTLIGNRFIFHLTTLIREQILLSINGSLVGDFHLAAAWWNHIQTLKSSVAEDILAFSWELTCWNHFVFTITDYI